MATKAELLAELALLDTDVLQKLVDYSNQILIPNEDMLINVTSSQLIEYAHTLADTYFPGWTDRSKADFGQFLLELFSLFSEKDFWYVNAFANEVFIQLAASYTAVYLHSLRLGYRPVVLAPATGSVLVTFSAGNEEVIKPGELIVTCLENNLNYTNTEEFTVPFSAGAIDVAVTVGEGSYNSVQKSFNGRSVQIVDIASALEYCNLTVNDIAWTYQQSLSKSSAASKDYIVFPADFGIEIYFGDGVYGIEPVVEDTIVVLYLATSGFEGNLAPEAAATIGMTIQTSPTARTATAASYEADEGFTGGNDYESIESMRANADMYFRTRDGIINHYDCIDQLNALPEVRKSIAYNFLHNLYYKVILTSEVPATVGDLTTITEKLRDRTVMGFSLSGIVTTYHLINEISLNAYILLGYDAAEIRSAIKEHIVNYTNPDTFAEYGQDFILADVADGMISSIAGLQNIVFITLDSVPAESVVVPQYEILDKMDAADITVTVYSE